MQIPFPSSFSLSSKVGLLKEEAGFLTTKTTKGEEDEEEEMYIATSAVNNEKKSTLSTVEQNGAERKLTCL